MATGHSPPSPAKSRIATTMGKARILMEAMPYIQEFRGKTMVIKYGGSAMVDDQLRHSFAGDVTLLSLVGIKPVVVHGGGPQINQALAAMGIESQWVNGLRVSDERTIKVVQSVLECAQRLQPRRDRLCTVVGVYVGLEARDVNQ